MNNTVATFTNAEYGIEVTVMAVKDGFAVRLRDTDADKYFPATTIYRKKADAIAYAEFCTETK